MNNKCIGIPEFLRGEVVFFNNLILSRNEKSQLVLLKNLNFYEFRNKHLVNSIALNKTIFSKIKLKIDALETCIDEHSERTPFCEITFGKYIYQNFEYKQLYILIKCWDKLVVLHRDKLAGLKLEAEYENVEMYKLTQGNIEYQAVLLIYINNSGDKFTIRKNFQEDVKMTHEMAPSSQPKSEFFKKLLDKIKVAKTELAVHRSITLKEYRKLKNFSNFGCNYIRSMRIDEKIILSKCADVWARLTSHDDLVIGVPIYNNSNAPRLTILRNLFPFIMLDKDNAELQYDFKFFQLKQDLSDLDSMESVFQFHNQRQKWMPNEEFTLLPQTFSVLLIKFKLSSIILHCRRNVNYPLFLFYELIIPDESAASNTTVSFPLQYFVQNVKFDKILEDLSSYYITFNTETFHQDLLTLMYTSIELHVVIKFMCESSLNKFEEILQKKFQFEKTPRLIKSGATSNQESQIADENINQSNEVNTFHQDLFFNNKINSIWHGSLVIRDVIHHENNPLLVGWSFFTNTNDKSMLLVKLITNEMITVGSNVHQIKFLEDQSIRFNIQEFENSIRTELCEMDKLYQNDLKTTDGQRIKIFERLLYLRMKTDLISTSIP